MFKTFNKWSCWLSKLLKLFLILCKENLSPGSPFLWRCLSSPFFIQPPSSSIFIATLQFIFWFLLFTSCSCIKKWHSSLCQEVQETDVTVSSSAAPDLLKTVDLHRLIWHRICIKRFTVNKEPSRLHGSVDEKAPVTKHLKTCETLSPDLH